MRDSSSSIHSRSTSSLVSELDLAFRDLDILLSRIRSVRAALAHRRSSSAGVSSHSLPVAILVPNDDPPQAIVVSPPREPLLAGGLICHGDSVLFFNPRPFQQDTGVASHSRGRFIYVHTPNGSEIHRYEKNLLLLL